MSEVNAARRQLIEYEHKLQEEREKISRAEVSSSISFALFIFIFNIII